MINVRPPTDQTPNTPAPQPQLRGGHRPERQWLPDDYLSTAALGMGLLAVPLLICLPVLAMLSSHSSAARTWMNDHYRQDYRAFGICVLVSLVLQVLAVLLGIFRRKTWRGRIALFSPLFSPALLVLLYIVERFIGNFRIL